MRKKVSIGLVLVLVVNTLLAAIGSAAATSFKVDSMLPAAGSKGVSLETDRIQLLFDREVKPGTGEIKVIAENAASPILEIQITPQSNLDYVTKRLDIKLSAINSAGQTLVPNTVYHVTGTEGAFTDAANEAVRSEAFDLTFTSLSEANSKAPELHSIEPFKPASGTMITGTSQEFQLSFDKPVIKGKGNIYIKSGSNNGEIARLAVSDALVKISGNTVTWEASGLKAGERYYVLVDRGAFVDIDNQPFKGISSAQDWYVQVQGASVTLGSIKPAKNATNVGINESIELNFSRPVYPNNGQIELRLTQPPSGTNALVKAFNVTSSDVMGGGTSKITIKAPTLKYSTGYTVVVPANAFRDSDGNGTTAETWNFKTGTAESTSLLIRSLSPSDGSTGNDVSRKLTATFNSDIKLLDDNGISLYRQGTAGSIAVKVEVSGRQLTITPTVPLQDSSTYYVDIASGAVADAKTGALFKGLSGAQGWTFLTQAADRTVPVLQSATMYNNTTIRLLYNKSLDSSVNLMTSSFSVFVNGESRQISDAYISGESVYVTLDTGVAVGQHIKISYSTSGLRPIQDQSGNKVASISSKDVLNGISSVLPKPTKGTVSGRTLTLQFSDRLKDVSSNAIEQFQVTVNGYYSGIDRLYQSGSIVTLYLSSSVSNGDTVKVSYSPGSYPLQDDMGQNISGFSDYFVRNTYDTIPPKFTGVRGSGNQIVLTYDEALNPAVVPMKSQFSVLVNNAPVYVTQVEMGSNEVKLTLASSFTKEQNVTLSYVSGRSGIEDLNGNLAGYIDLQPVNYSAITEGVQSATVQGDTITITYNTSLRSASVVPTNTFYVTADKVNVIVQSVSVSGNAVTIKLAQPVSSSQSVEVTYTAGANTLYDSAGNPLKSYMNMPVANVSSTDSGTTGLGGQPSYLSLMTGSDYGVEGYVFAGNTAQKTSSRSKYGQVITKYTFDDAKVREGFEFLNKVGEDGKMLVFEVPSSEKAAEVAVPLAPLMETYNKGMAAPLGVKYGNHLYALQAKDIPYFEISRKLNSSTLTGVHLLVRIEPLSKSILPSLPPSAGVTVNTLSDPVEVYVAASNSTGLYEFSQPGSIYVRATNQLPTQATSLVKYDLGARSVSYLPSKSKAGTMGQGEVLVGEINGTTILGPIAGYGYYNDIVNHWAKNDIAELAGRLIINSPSNGASYSFEPDKYITRADFAAFLVKGLGLPVNEQGTNRFPDVPFGKTSGYIDAAANAGIINGYTDGTFKPNSYITREQMALMMVRAMEYSGYNMSGSGADTQTLNRFVDRAKIQSPDTVAKAVKEGIIQGVSSNMFEPQGNATRAQAAVMLKRVLSKLEYL